MVQIDPVVGSISKQYDADSDEESEFIAKVEKNIGWKVTISKYDQKSNHHHSQNELDSSHSAIGNMFE